MFGSNTIDIAIGLISLFLLLSLIASAANEIIEGMVKKRAKDLKTGIEELVGGDGAKQFLELLYGHGLINSLFRGTYGKAEAQLPSYIPSRNFALAVIDVAQKFKAEEDAAKAAGTPCDLMLPNNIRTALETLKTAAGTDAEKYEKSVEDWYNSAMDRVSGWYKRRSQTIIFFLGLALAVSANADCIGYTKRLSSDASLRQSVVAYAEATAKTDPTKDTGKTATERIEAEMAQLDGIGLPIGWKAVSWYDPVTDFQRVCGWLLTALAVSLGAPFWFDMLNKIMVIRSTVKPHEKSKEEKSKDPAQTAIPGKP